MTGLARSVRIIAVRDAPREGVLRFPFLTAPRLLFIAISDSTGPERDGFVSVKFNGWDCGR